jgi:recombination protein RecA
MVRTPKKSEINLDELVADVRGALKNDLTILKDVELWIPTGIPQLDVALGGGLPAGRLVTLIGAKSVGKSTLSIHCLAQIQKHKGIALGLDVERSNLKTRCEAQGLDMARYLACQPESLDTYEEENIDTGKKVKVKGAFDIMEHVIRVVRQKDKDALIGIVLDSVAGSSVAQEMEADIGKAGMGAHSRILSQAFRKIMPVIHDMNCILILVNQLKQKIGVMFGNPDTYIGKNPIDFHSAITLEMTRGKSYPEAAKDEDAEGITTRINVSKNKVGKPFGRVEYITFFDRGIDTLWESIGFLKANSAHLGTTAGYYEWDGKKRRQKEFYEQAKADPKISEKIFQLTKEVVSEKLKNIETKVDDPRPEIPEKASAE